MIKEENPIFRKVVLIVCIIFLANVGMLIYTFKSSSTSFTGFSIGENISKTYASIPFSSKISLLIQWLLLLFVLIFAYIKDKGVKSRKQELSGINLQKVAGKGTDLDTLYALLQKKKQLRISTISKIFKINKDIAMDWCKTLESGNLAVIDYPGLGEPVVNLVG